MWRRGWKRERRGADAKDDKERQHDDERDEVALVSGNAADELGLYGLIDRGWDSLRKAR